MEIHKNIFTQMIWWRNSNFVYEFGVKLNYFWVFNFFWWNENLTNTSNKKNHSSTYKNIIHRMLRDTRCIHTWSKKHNIFKMTTTHLRCHFSFFTFLDMHEIISIVKIKFNVHFPQPSGSRHLKIRGKIYIYLYIFYELNQPI